MDIVINNYSIVNVYGQYISKHDRKLDPNVRYEQREILPYLTQAYLAMHEVAYKVTLLRDNNYVQTEGVSYTDQEWVLFPVAWAKSATFIRENIYLYLIGREGQTVSANAAYKNITHFEVRILNTIKLYNTFQDIDEQSAQYLWKRIISETERVYLRYLYMGRNYLDTIGLYKFDQDLKRLNIGIYSALDGEKLLGFIPFYYIKIWRSGENNKLRMYNPLIDVLLYYKNINFKLKSLFARTFKKK